MTHQFNLAAMQQKIDTATQQNLLDVTLEQIKLAGYCIERIKFDMHPTDYEHQELATAMKKIPGLSLLQRDLPISLMQTAWLVKLTRCYNKLSVLENQCSDSEAEQLLLHTAIPTLYNFLVEISYCKKQHKKKTALQKICASLQYIALQFEKLFENNIFTSNHSVRKQKLLASIKARLIDAQLITQIMPIYDIVIHGVPLPIVVTPEEKKYSKNNNLYLCKSNLHA